MADKCVLALDLGTSSLKCLVASLEGKRLAMGRRPIAYFQPKGLSPMALEFSPETVWQEACGLIQKCLAKAKVQGDGVAAVSATSQRGGMVFLDRRGREVYCGPNQDVRAFFDGMALDEERGGEVYSITGHLPSFLFAPARLQWFKVHRPRLFREIQAVLPISDWLGFKLSGQIISERSALGEIGLLNLRTGRNDPSLVQGLDLQGNLVPAIGDAGEEVGRVTTVASLETGLKNGTPVALGGPDTQCGLLGMGVVEPRELGIVLGWSGPLQMVTSELLLDLQRRTWSGQHVIPGRWVLESSTTEAGRSLDWFSEVLGVDHEKAYSKGIRRSEDSETLACDQNVAFLGPRIMNVGKLGLQMGGLLFPVPVGRTGITRSRLLRGALENLAFAVRGNALQLAEVSGIKASKVSLSGGVARIAALPQLVADSLGREIRVPEMKDSSLLGAAMCAATGAKAYGSLSEAASAMMGGEVEVEPDKSSASLVEERYERWLSLYHRLETLQEAM